MITTPESPPSPPKWVAGRFNTSELTLAPGFTLNVTWESISPLKPNEPQWNVIIFGRRLKLRAFTQEQAKARAVNVAKNWVRQLAERLELIP